VHRVFLVGDFEGSLDASAPPRHMSESHRGCRGVKAQQ
jgi:hypothetical protein